MEEVVFAPKHIGPLREGNKTSTIRAWGSAYRLLPGDVFTAVTPDGDIIGNQTCTDVEARTIRDIVDNGVEGHKEYETVEELIGEMSRYYPERSFTASTTLQIPHFE